MTTSLVTSKVAFSKSDILKKLYVKDGKDEL
jgi:hypothetical protein